jgi:hypothetical protein
LEPSRFGVLQTSIGLAADDLLQFKQFVYP